MKGRHVILGLLIAALLLPFQVGPVAAAGRAPDRPQASGATPGLRVLASTETAITLELVTPTFDAETVATAEGPCDRVTVAGYGETTDSGWPQLPIQGATVAIPPHADVSLVVLEAEGTVVGSRYAVCPVPQPIVEFDLAGQPRYGGERIAKDIEAYATHGAYPAAVAEVVETGFARGQRLAQLRFSPLQFDPAARELVHYPRIVVRLDYAQAPGWGLVHAPRPLAGGAGGTAEARRWFPSDTAAVTLVPIAPSADVLGASMAPAVLNADLAAGWLVASELATSPSLLHDLPADGSPAYKVFVTEDGIHAVTYNDLETAGADLAAIDPATLRLTNQGVEVAIRVTGAEDGAFDPGDAVIFYGQPMDTRFTGANVYWLTWGGASGLRMASAGGQPTGTATEVHAFLTTARIEENHVYLSQYPSGEGNQDHWYWAYVYANGAPASRPFAFSLQHVAPGADIVVRGLIKGVTGTPNHHTRVLLNDTLLDDATWSGTLAYTFEAVVPGAALLEGANAFTVEAGADASVTRDLVYVNNFEIDYHRRLVAQDDRLAFEADGSGQWAFPLQGFSAPDVEVYDVSVPSAPVRITDSDVALVGDAYQVTVEAITPSERAYVALTPAQYSRPAGVEADRPSDLTATENGADYLIITYDGFYDDVLPLAEYRASQGLRTAVVRLQDIYDEFTYGVVEPEAIRDFVAYAYTNWTAPAPAYVLLVGDGHYDFRDYLGTGEPVFMPPYLAEVDYWIGEAAADNRYVCVSGDDVLPDMALGRLPVRTTEQARAVVEKIIAYEQAPGSGSWNEQVLFVSDNPDTAGPFYTYSDVLADDYLPAPYVPDKVYHLSTHMTTTESRTAILGALNAGRLLVNYVGHGAVQQWASEGLFRRSDIAGLTNAGRLPFVVTMACLDGQFTNPSPAGQDASSTAETLVRTPQVGSIATWAGTGMGLATGHDRLNRALFTAIFAEGTRELGPAVVQAKAYVFSSTTGYRDQIDEYTLFGDPAQRLNVLTADVTVDHTVAASDPVRSGDAITYTLTFANAGVVTARDVTIEGAFSAPLANPAVRAAGDVLIWAETPESTSWSVAELAPGARGVLTVTGTVDPSFVGELVSVVSITTATVEDNLDNNTSNASLMVEPPPLTADAGPDRDAVEGDTVQFAGAYAPVSEALDYTITWDFGDGQTAEGTLTPAHRYAAEGVYRVTLRVSDGTVTAEDTCDVTVSNAAPVVSIHYTAEGVGPRQVVLLVGEASDPGDDAIEAIEWDFGDGTTASGDLIVEHAFATGGIFTVTLSVTDAGGATGSAQATVCVRCELIPIGIHRAAVDGIETGRALSRVVGGTDVGMFGWLSWDGDLRPTRLVTSLALPGDSETYVNPLDPGDRLLSVGDWVSGRTNSAGAKAIKDALRGLVGSVVTVPVWDVSAGSNRDLVYHVVGFAHVEIVSFSLGGQDTLSLIYNGAASCP